MTEHVPACPRCGEPTQLLATRVPTAAFQLGPQTPEMSRPAVIIECTDQEDCRWAAEVRDPTPDIVKAATMDTAVRRLDEDMAGVDRITDDQARALAHAAAEHRYLTTLMGEANAS